MTYKALTLGSEELVNKMLPLYKKEILRGTFKITAHATFENNSVNIANAIDKLSGAYNFSDFDFILVSPQSNFYEITKQLESKGMPRDKIIDGRVFEIKNLDFLRFLEEGIAYSVLDKKIFNSNARIIYPKVHETKDGRTTLSLGRKSYIRYGSTLEGPGLISLGNFSSFAPKIFFSLGQNFSHNYLNVGTVPLSSLDWKFPKEFWPPRGSCRILIGSDVWCGRGSIFKCVNPNKPLVIGNGAVIASNSVVVKNVPPYAIVGGNPAQVIKYRFEPHIIEALLRIKWWDWNIDKIYENYKYFNDVEKFISLNDK